MITLHHLPVLSHKEGTVCRREAEPQSVDDPGCDESGEVRGETEEEPAGGPQQAVDHDGLLWSEPATDISPSQTARY